MLKGTKSISLSYQSIIHNEESGDRIAVYMSAQIPESGRSNSSKTITRQIRRNAAKIWLTLITCYLIWKTSRPRRQEDQKIQMTIKRRRKQSNEDQE